jgi:hypothetical protein
MNGGAAESKPEKSSFFADFTARHLEGIVDDVRLSIASSLSEGEAAGASTDQAARDLESALLGSGWRWPAFEGWRGRFAGLGAYPAMWIGLETLPAAPPQLAEALTRWDRLGAAPRRLLVSHYWPMPFVELLRRSGLKEWELEAVLAELAEAGFARRLRTPGERLELLRVPELRALAKRAGVKGAKRKAELIAKMRAAGDDRLAELLPPELPAEGVAVDGFSDELTPWLRYERARIFLFAHTARASWWAAQQQSNAIENVAALVSGMLLEVLGQGEDPCPVCPKRAGRRVDPRDARADDLPPFHPGCRCTVVLWHPDWKDATAKARRETEAFLRRRLADNRYHEAPE